MTTVGESFHRHVLAHSHVGGDKYHNHVEMAVEASDQRGQVTAPKEFLEGLAPLLLLAYEGGESRIEVDRDDLALVVNRLSSVKDDVGASVRAALARLRSALPAHCGSKGPDVVVPPGGDEGATMGLWCREDPGHPPPHRHRGAGATGLTWDVTW